MSTLFTKTLAAKIGLPIPLAALLIAVAWLTGCAGTPSKTQAPVDNVRTIKSVRAQPATATAGASQTEHITTVQPASPEKIALAQRASGDYFSALQLMKNGKFDDALLVLQSVAAQFPTLAGPLVNQGVIHLHQEKWLDAIYILDQAIKVNANNPYAWNLRGIALRETGKFKEARQSYEQALAIDPLFAKAHFNLAILADLYLQDLALALRHYERYQALQKKPDPAVSTWITDLRNRLRQMPAPTAPDNQMPAPTAPAAG